MKLNTSTLPFLYKGWYIRPSIVYHDRPQRITNLKGCLLHHNSATQLLHGGNDLLGVLLGHVLLHHLGRTLDEFLAVYQAETQHALDLLDDLGLGRRLKRRQLQGEKVLLLRRRGSILGFFDGGGSGRGGSEAANRKVGNV